jgi:hypothetical protein
MRECPLTGEPLLFAEAMLKLMFVMMVGPYFCFILGQSVREIVESLRDLVVQT